MINTSYVVRKLVYENETASSMEDHETAFSFSLMLFLSGLLLSLLIAYIIICYYDSRYKARESECEYIPEPACYILIGFLLSCFVHLTDKMSTLSKMMEEYLVFESNIFFYFLLPIIIFDSGYINIIIVNRFNMGSVKFFQNIGSIVILAFVNTFLTAVFIGVLLYFASWASYIHSFSFLNTFLFGSIISATDTISVLSIFSKLGVDDTLYALVFGESMFNDAVAIVLYKSLISFQYIDLNMGSIMHGIVSFCSIFLGSLSCGILMGSLITLLFKYTNIQQPRNKDFERAVLLITPFLCYMFAEGLNMSGIVAMLFCGIVMSRYTEHNMSGKTYLLFFNLFFIFLIFL